MPPCGGGEKGGKRKRKKALLNRKTKYAPANCVHSLYAHERGGPSCVLFLPDSHAWGSHATLTYPRQQPFASLDCRPRARPTHRKAPRFFSSETRAGRQSGCKSRVHDAVIHLPNSQTHGPVCKSASDRPGSGAGEVAMGGKESLGRATLPLSKSLPKSQPSVS